MTSTAEFPIATVHDRYSDDDIAAYYGSGFWQTSSLIDVINERAELRPDKRFVFDSTTSLTFGDFREQVVRTAAGLRRHGVAVGDRVAVQLPNWTEFVVIAAAISRIGAVLVPIMPIYRDDEVGFVLRQCRGQDRDHLRGIPEVRVRRHVRATPVGVPCPADRGGGPGNRSGRRAVRVRGAWSPRVTWMGSQPRSVPAAGPTTHT